MTRSSSNGFNRNRSNNYGSCIKSRCNATSISLSGGSKLGSVSGCSMKAAILKPVASAAAPKLANQTLIVSAEAPGMVVIAVTSNRSNPSTESYGSIFKWYRSTSLAPANDPPAIQDVEFSPMIPDSAKSTVDPSVSVLKYVKQWFQQRLHQRWFEMQEFLWCLDAGAQAVAPEDFKWYTFYYISASKIQSN